MKIQIKINDVDHHGKEYSEKQIYEIAEKELIKIQNKYVKIAKNSILHLTIVFQKEAIVEVRANLELFTKGLTNIFCKAIDSNLNKAFADVYHKLSRQLEKIHFIKTHNK